MDVNEAYQKLRVTDDEVKAIQDYLGFAHTSINMLSNLAPRAYYELSKTGWDLAENREDLEKKIKIFVDMYSLMYKDSLGSKASRGFVRGTSGKRARALYGTNTQFLSTSRDERVAKRFCEYKNSALVRISIGEGVPHLYSDAYIEQVTNEDEQEVIIAPFCKIKDNQLVSRWEGYEYYNVSIEKGELQEKSKEEIESLTSQVVGGYEQNLADMKEFVRLEDRIDYLREKLQRTVDAEDRKYISQDLKTAQDEFHTVWQRTTAYKDNLNALLQGMCREKEKEVDEARAVVEQDIEQRNKDFEAKRKEEERVGAIIDFKMGIDGAIQKTRTINGEISATYQQLLETEKVYKEFAEKFGLGVTSSVEGKLGEAVTSVNSLIKAARRGLEEVEISDDSTLEQTQAQASQYARKIDGIDASMKIAGTLKEVTEVYSVQAEDSIKRDLYIKMNSLIQRTRITLLQQQSIKIKDEKAGIFDGITGKSKLRKMQLQNIDLKMQLVSRTKPEVKSYYSVHDMLAEMYAFSQTELDGKQTPEIAKLYTTMKSEFKAIGGKPISTEEIQKHANPKIEKYQQQNLPAVPKKKFRLFGKIKDQMEYLQVQNSQLQTQINNINGSNFSSQIRSPEKPATEIFKQRLMDIVHNIDADEEPIKTPDKTRDDTVDLWK